MRRHEVKSTIMTSKRPFEDWGRLIGEVPSATAILDRSLRRRKLFQISVKSYRLGNREEVSNGANHVISGILTQMSVHQWSLL